MKEILTIVINITGYNEVKGHSGEAAQICFDGYTDSEIFKGKILPGGVDTQQQKKNEGRFLSARYILEGTDSCGKNCRMFIENNGCFDADGNIVTKPRIITDSEALAFLEKEELSGTVTGREGGVIIHIFTNQE